MGATHRAELANQAARAAIALIVALAVVVGIQAPALAAPPDVSPISDTNVDEGAPGFTGQVATFTDADLGGTFTATIDWGDSTIDNCPADCTINDLGGGNGTVAGAHVYVDDGPNTVTVTVDDGTEFGVGSFVLTVDNVAPTVALSGAASVNEGSVYSLTIGAVSDPGDDTVADWIVDWGDGTAQTYPSGGVKTHTYADGTTTPTISIDLTDEDGTYTSVDTLGITVNNVAPTIALTGNASVNEGAVYTLTLGAVTDPGADTPTGYIINWGDGTTPQNVGGLGAVTHTFANGDTSPNISVSVVDDDGTHGAAGTRPITVNNVAPTVTAPATGTVTEGGTLASSIGFTDPGTIDTHTATVDYDDGGGVEALGAVTSPFSLDNTYDDNGSFSVDVVVTDNDGGFDDATIAVTVNNANPVVVARDDATVAEGGTVFIGGGGGTSYTDAGSADTHTATVDWDDGDGPESATVSNGDVINSSHSYNDPGTYTVVVRVTDDDGGIGMSSFTVNVQNLNFNVTASAVGGTSIDEGDTTSLMATFVDNDGTGTYSATINWGDGTIANCATPACTVTITDPGEGTVTGSHTYTQDGNYVVVVSVNDGGIDNGTNGFTYTVANVLPTTNVTGPGSSAEGTQIQLLGSPFDPGVDDPQTYEWVVTKNGQPFKTGTNKNIQVRPDDNGTYRATYVVSDDDGQSAPDVFTWTVTNVAPTAVIIDNDSGDPVQGVTDIGVEGSTITLGADVTDPGTADTFEYEWEISQPGSPSITGTDPTISFVSPDDGLFFVSLTVTDDDGASFSPSVPIISVVNGDPVIVNIVTDATPSIGGNVNLGIFFEDPGSLDTHTVTVTWGDGSTSTVDPAVSPVATSHTYPTSGPRRAQVCVEDDNGGSTCAKWWYNVGGVFSSATDYDGDGYEDLAVGVPGEDNGAGAVHVIYGSAASLQASDDQFLRQGKGGLVGTKEAGDAFGTSLASGDFNGDGYTDLASGAPGEDLGSANDAGNVTVILGSSSGLNVASSSAWHQDRAGVPDSNENGDGFGQALVAGDFNGDAYADLAIGTPFENVGGVADTGRVTILYGSPSGLKAAGARVVGQGVGSITNSNQTDDHYGAALAAGDFDGDGLGDLAIGVPGQKVSGSARAGAVNVLFGRLLGFDINAPDLFIRQGSNGVLGSPGANDEFGSVLGAGDLNDDGVADLVAGVPGDAVNGKVDAGSVAVLPGSSAGPSGTGDVLFREGANGLDGGTAKRDRFGASVAVGDVTGDGIDDLLIGIPNQKVSGLIRAGTAAFIPGSPTLSTAGNSRWHEDKAKILGTAQKDDHLASAVAVRDTDGDGNADIALGVPDQNRGGKKDVGAVLVVRGGNNGPVKKGDSRWWQGRDGLADDAQKFDRFGAAF